MGLREAESVKLFSNIYLALRVAYFNGLSTCCEMKNLNTADVIQRVCIDFRIGDFVYLAIYFHRIDTKMTGKNKNI